MRFDGNVGPSGILDIEQKSHLRRYLLSIPEGTALTIHVDKRKSQRSISQNRLYWGFLNIIEQETGNPADDLHELFKRKFLRPDVKMILGTEVTLPGSTTQLSKGEFSDYLDKICALTGIPVPDPSSLR